MHAVIQEGTERRGHERFDYTAEVVVGRADEEFEALSKDVAAGGMCIVFAHEAPLAVGEHVAVRFRVPDLAQPIEAPAIVRWIGGPDRAAAGLQFTQGLRARETWAITRLRSSAG